MKEGIIDMINSILSLKGFISHFPLILHTIRAMSFSLNSIEFDKMAAKMVFTVLIIIEEKNKNDICSSATLVLKHKITNVAEEHISLFNCCRRIKMIYVLLQQLNKDAIQFV